MTQHRGEQRPALARVADHAAEGEGQRRPRSAACDRSRGCCDQAFGFSNGCAALALKKPPPLVPSCLIASCVATGPSAMVCLAPSSVVASTEPASVCGMPEQHEGEREHDRQRQQDVERRAGHIDPEIADGLARRCARRRATSASASAMPVAAERKFCTVSPAIWHEMAHGGLAAIGLPVGVGDEADRGVEGEVRRTRGEALRIERQHVLQPHAAHRATRKPACVEDQHRQRIGEPALLLCGSTPASAIEAALDRRQHRREERALALEKRAP